MTQPTDNERFGTLRSALAQPATIANFGEVIRILQEWEAQQKGEGAQESFTAALYYAKEHLTSWPEHTRYAQLFPSSALFSFLAPLYQCFGTYDVREQYEDETQGGSLTLFLHPDEQPRYFYTSWWSGFYDGTRDTQHGRVTFEENTLHLFPEHKRRMVFHDIGEDDVDERSTASGQISIPMKWHDEAGIFIPQNGFFSYDDEVDWSTLQYAPPDVWSLDPFYGGEFAYGEFEFIPMNTTEYQRNVADVFRKLQPKE